MWSYNYTDELYHYGVPGMKWGVRNKRVPSEDYQRAKAIRKKKMKERSNAELKDVNNRLNLENTYRDNARKNNAGNRAAKAFIATAGTLAAVGSAVAIYAKHGKKIANGINKSVKVSKFLKAATTSGVKSPVDGHTIKVTGKQAAKALGTVLKDRILK